MNSPENFSSKILPNAISDVGGRLVDKIINKINFLISGNKESVVSPEVVELKNMSDLIKKIIKKEEVPLSDFYKIAEHRGRVCDDVYEKKILSTVLLSVLNGVGNHFRYEKFSDNFNLKYSFDGLMDSHQSIEGVCEKSVSLASNLIGKIEGNKIVEVKKLKNTGAGFEIESEGDLNEILNEAENCFRGQNGRAILELLKMVYSTPGFIPTLQLNFLKKKEGGDFLGLPIRGQGYFLKKMMNSSNSDLEKIKNVSSKLDPYYKSLFWESFSFLTNDKIAEDDFLSVVGSEKMFEQRKPVDTNFKELLETEKSFGSNYNEDPEIINNEINRRLKDEFDHFMNPDRKALNAKWSETPKNLLLDKFVEIFALIDDQKNILAEHVSAEFLDKFNPLEYNYALKQRMKNLVKLVAKAKNKEEVIKILKSEKFEEEILVQGTLFRALMPEFLEYPEGINEAMKDVSAEKIKGGDLIFDPFKMDDPNNYKHPEQFGVSDYKMIVENLKEAYEASDPNTLKVLILNIAQDLMDESVHFYLLRHQKKLIGVKKTKEINAKRKLNGTFYVDRKFRAGFAVGKVLDNWISNDLKAGEVLEGVVSPNSDMLEVYLENNRIITGITTDSAKKKDGEMIESDWFVMVEKHQKIVQETSDVHKYPKEKIKKLCERGVEKNGMHFEWFDVNDNQEVLTRINDFLFGGFVITRLYQENKKLYLVGEVSKKSFISDVKKEFLHHELLNELELSKKISKKLCLDIDFPSDLDYENFVNNHTENLLKKLLEGRIDDITSFLKDKNVLSFKEEIVKALSGIKANSSDNKIKYSIDRFIYFYTKPKMFLPHCLKKESKKKKYQNRSLYRVCLEACVLDLLDIMR